MEKLTEAHFFSMPSQGNIYTMTEINLVNGSTKLLVASLKREIFCFEFQESPTGTLVPTTKEISFTYIPNAAEIISLDAFNKSLTSNEFVIGITIIKNSNDSDTLETYLNIYSEWEETEEFNIDNIAQSCLNVELNFIPYMLMHTYLVTWNGDQIESKEMVFVLTGSDHQVHIYQEQMPEHIYKEISNKDNFPEFTKMPSPVIWIHIYYTDDFSNRITSLACECGYVKLMKVDVKTHKVLYNFSTRFQSYVSRVHIYPEHKLKSDTNFGNLTQLLKPEPNDEKLNLIVVNALLPAVIFYDVLTYGLSNYSPLPRLDRCSILSCCEVADINFDGCDEIIIGNSSAEVMLYRKDKEQGWCLDELKTLSSPIFGVKYVDMSGDGVKELVVFSMKGVHIFQHDLLHIQEVLNIKLQKILAVKSEP